MRLHLETTNRCTLKCPACPRTVWNKILGMPVETRDLDYTLLYKFLDCDSGQQVTELLLCGDYGDTLYYPKLLDFIKDFRQYEFIIATNGSYKKQSWWEELARLLTPEDIVRFAVDGIGQEQNEKYRINCDWNSMVVGIDTLRKYNIKLECETLNFKFNVDDLDKIESWAISKGMTWTGKKTHRFGNDEIIPSDNYVLARELYNDDFALNTPIDITPRCDSAKVITSENYFLPCDWIRNPLTYFKSNLYNDKKWLDRLDIARFNLDDCLIVLEEWKQEVIENGKKGTCDVLCKMKCRTYD